MPKLSLKSRIIGHGEEAPDNLTANPLNFRRHPKEQLNALRGSMKELGWIKTVIVNKRSGYVLDGHARVEEAIRQGLPSIPVTYVDLDDNEEKLALALLDPITNMAYHDSEVMKSLIDQIHCEDEQLNEIVQSIANESIPTILTADNTGMEKFTDIIKQITLFYDELSYACVAKSLLDYSKNNNCDDNSEVIKSLLRKEGYEIP
jgi:hypothetical protein